MLEKVPFLPIGTRTAAKLMRFLNPLSSVAARFRPSLEAELAQMEAGVDAATYLSISILAAFYGFVAIFLISLALLELASGTDPMFLAAPFLGAIIFGTWALFQRVVPKAKRRPELLPTVITIALSYYIFFFIFFLALTATPGVESRHITDIFTFLLPISSAFSVFVFLQVFLYPHVIVGRKMRALNRDMLFALRHLLIQVRSGVPLYNALVSVSDGGYGIISQEFGRTVKEVNSGVSQATALENMAMRNPSLYLRRAIWQVVNAIRAGSEISTVLESLVSQFAAEERVNLERFGREMGPWAMMYLLTTVIFPTLGITMLLVLPTITPIEVSSTLLFFFIIVFAAMQYFFIKLLKGKRPVVHFR